ncbi:hypothetical protein ES703_114080 [subsurface metagenome]
MLAPSRSRRREQHSPASPRRGEGYFICASRVAPGLRALVILYLSSLSTTQPRRHCPSTPLFCNFHGHLRIPYGNAQIHLERLKTRRIALASAGPGSSSGSKSLIFLPLRQRGCEGYSHWLMNRVARSNLQSLKGFLILTVDPSKYCCAHAAWMSIWKRWNSFRTNMRKRGYLTKYFCVLEPTKKFRPHFHILMNSSLLPRDDLSWMHSLWGSGIYYRFTNLRAPVRYLLKYLSKDLHASRKADSPLSKFHAYLRAFHLRQWSCSRGLLKPYKSPTLESWDYAGTYDSNLLANYLAHSDLTYEDGVPNGHDFLPSYGSTQRHLSISDLDIVGTDW